MKKKNNPKKTKEESGAIALITHNVDSIEVYMVKEEELDIFKNGPNRRYSWLLDVSIFLFGIFIQGLLVTLTKVQFVEDKYKYIFLSIMWGSLILGGIVLLLYFTIRKDDVFSKTMKNVISRKH